MKTYIVVTHMKHLAEALLVSKLKICFRGEIRKYQYFFCQKSALSGAMLKFVLFFFLTGSDMQEVIGTAIAFYLLSNGKYVNSNLILVSF